MANSGLDFSLTKSSVDNTIKTLEALKEKIEFATQDATKEIISTGVKLAQEFDSSAPDTGNYDYNFGEYYESNDTKGSVVMYGLDSVYVEFGTGDIGASNPHPRKNDVSGLNKYNSGKTIRVNSKGEHYWKYPPMANLNEYYGEEGYTRGIPAGLQMYNTLNELQNIAPSIARKHISQAIQRYTKR